MLEFRLLGPLEVREGEQVVRVHRQKHRALVAALALRAGEIVSQDRLVDDLWGERPPKTARHALENYVSEVRRIVGRDLIRTHPGGYELAVDPQQVDVVRFERALADARGKEAGERAELLERALALRRGAPLADFAFEPFAEQEAARLAELEVRAQEELVDAQLELGRHDEAVALLEPLVAAHPYRERLRGQLMLALYRSGRQADALATYQDARAALVEELGIDPGDELQELQRAILRQDASLRAPSAEPAGEPQPSAPAPAARAGRKTVSILAAGLANAADLAAHLDPEPLSAVLDRWTELGRRAVERHGGAWQPRAGGAVQAVFGVPFAHEDDALRAVRAAVELREGVSALNEVLLADHGVFLELRAGVATGEVLVQPEKEDVATGHTVSVAAKLEGDARPGQILLGAETHVLVRDLVVAEPVDDGGAVRLVELLPDAARPLRLDSPLVGRRRQLAALESAFENAVSDRTLHLFTVLGSAGVGKSRLVQELLEAVAERAVALRARCLPYGEGIEYRPLRDAGLAADDEPEPEAVRARLEALARERPVVLALDDLQWADARLLDLLAQVADRSREAPILLLCSARPELLEVRPTWGGGKPNASSLLVEPLSEGDAERLLDNLLGESDLPDSVRDYIVRTSEGNPLYVEELLAMLVDRDILRREGGRWTTTQLPAIPMPPTVQALVVSRIDRLPESERVVLELASVEGKVFERSTVAALAPEDVADVDAQLVSLVRKELVRPAADEEGRFTFRHQLIRDAAYASMPMRTRAELHHSLARRLETSDAELAAYHDAQAERYRAELGAA